MKDKTVGTIVIGAGISGLACAQRLQENNQDFLIISKNVGGRIQTSEDGATNYGAFFVCSDFHHVLKYVTLQSQIRLSDFCFHEKDDNYVLFEPQLLLYFFQFTKILKILYKFRKKLRSFRIETESISQKKAIENDSYLNSLYMKNAFDFVKEKKLEKGTQKYLSKGLYSTTFSKVSEMNAFSFLQYLLPLITPIFTFTFEKEKMIAPFQDKLVLDSVTDIIYKNGQYTIKSSDNIFYAKNIVLATEISWSQRFAGVKKTNKPVSTNMLHIKGDPKSIISPKKYQLFTQGSNVQAIASLKDDTYLFYYKSEPPSLNKFFIKPQIIAKKTWDPAGTINGHTLIESNRGSNMYLIGDYNIADLEESYITGLYAANQIIKSF